jgi:glutaredoxin
LIVVELYSKSDCHLCDTALAVLQEVQKRHSFELKVIKLQEGDKEFELYKERFPVVFINKKFAFQYRITDREIISALREATAGE